MKTIIRISPHAVDTPERVAAEKLPAMAIQMLAEAYAQRRAELNDDALLILGRGQDDRTVYITVGARPPELAIGGRRVHAVFAPPDSQEPIATFADRSHAVHYATTHWPADPIDADVESSSYKISEIDATDRPVVRVAVAALMLHEGKVLLGKLKKSGLYVLPEAALEVGESNESAVQRAVKVATGLDVGTVSVSKYAPYVSTYVDKAGQHFITLVMATQYVGGDPVAHDPLWESVGWYDAEDPPRPLAATVQQIIALARFNANAEAPPQPTPATAEARPDQTVPEPPSKSPTRRKRRTKQPRTTRGGRTPRRGSHRSRAASPSRPGASRRVRT